MSRRFNSAAAKRPVKFSDAGLQAAGFLRLHCGKGNGPRLLRQSSANKLCRNGVGVLDKFLQSVPLAAVGTTAQPFWVDSAAFRTFKNNRAFFCHKVSSLFQAERIQLSKSFRRLRCPFR